MLKKSQPDQWCPYIAAVFITYKNTIHVTVEQEIFVTGNFRVFRPQAICVQRFQLSNGAFRLKIGQKLRP